MKYNATFSPLIRTFVVGSLLLGSLYPFAEPALQLPLSAAIKGLCVGLLAIAALIASRSTDGVLLAAVMAAGTAGDVLLALPDGFEPGAAAFGVGHILAIWLYWRNRKSAFNIATKVLVAVLLAIGLVVPQLIVPGDAGIAIYALLLTGMAAAAFASRFDRRVGVGATMFVVSDALIAVRIQNAEASDFTLGLAIWWLYYFGQFLIFWFVSKAIRTEQGR